MVKASLRDAAQADAQARTPQPVARQASAVARAAPSAVRTPPPGRVVAHGAPSVQRLPARETLRPAPRASHEKRTPGA